MRLLTTGETIRITPAAAVGSWPDQILTGRRTDSIEFKIIKKLNFLVKNATYTMFCLNAYYITINTGN